MLTNATTLFSICVFFQEHLRFTGHQGKGEGNLFNSSLLLSRHLEISRTITGESSPLLIASNRTRSGNHWFASASHLPLSYALLNSLSYTPYTNFRMYPILIALTIILIDYPIQLLFKLEGIF